jgi:hypothetical protein
MVNNEMQNRKDRARDRDRERVDIGKAGCDCNKSG